MAYTCFLTLLLAGAARAAEAALSALGRPLRWAWIAAAGASLLPLAAWALAAGGGGPAWLHGGGPAAGGVVLLPRVLADLRAAGGAPEGTWLAALRLPAPWARRLLAGWGLAAACGLAGWLGAHAWLRRVARSGVERRIGAARVVVTRNAGPAVAGAFRPYLVLPRWMMQLPPSARRAAWLHERAHLEARDPVFLAAAALLVALVPWNPALWWIVRRLRQAAELDCDRRVLEQRVEPRRYGDLLLEVGRRRSRVPLPAAAFVTPERSLERRILAMTRNAPRHGIARAAGLGGLAALAIVAACETPAPPAASSASAGSPTAPAASADANADVKPKFIPRDQDPKLQNGDEVVKALQEAYPTDLKAAGIRGRTVLWMLVDADGRVSRVNVEDSSGHEALDAAAEKVARTMRFEPATKDGSPIAVWIAQPIRFETSAPKASSAGEEASAPAGTRLRIRGDRTLELRADSVRLSALSLAGPVPLLFVDGVRVSARGRLNDIDPEAIACIEVLKGAAAREHYGPEADAGVIRITTKASGGSCATT